MHMTSIDEHARASVLSSSPCGVSVALSMSRHFGFDWLWLLTSARRPPCRTPKQAEGLREFQAYASRAALTEHIQRMPAQPAQARVNVAWQECAFLAAAGQVPAAGARSLSGGRPAQGGRLCRSPAADPCTACMLVRGMS